MGAFQRTGTWGESSSIVTTWGTLGTTWAGYYSSSLIGALGIVLCDLTPFEYIHTDLSPSAVIQADLSPSEDILFDLSPLAALQADLSPTADILYEE